MIISIEGNIGSGKSKFVELFKNYLEQETSYSDKFLFLSEPVDEWINTKNEMGVLCLSRWLQTIGFNPPSQFTIWLRKTQ